MIGSAMKIISFLKKYKYYLIPFIVILALISILPKINAVLALVTPPELPKAQAAKKIENLQQNWNWDVSHRFHHESQGTNTFPVPVEWFVALEQPLSSPLGLLFPGVDKNLFVDQKYLGRMGFLPSEKSNKNLYNLPIGFATTPFQHIAGLDDEVTSVGFTCAACHTGSLTYDDVEYIVQGGPSRADLGLFQASLATSLAQTLVTAKLPMPNRRFTRFAKRVLGEQYSSSTKAELLKQMTAVAMAAKAGISDPVQVTEGYGRLDALNRIGNQVFAKDYDRKENIAPITAPVNYPHIWTVSWFDWVQYDGSIMQPIIRNTGEALGVAASLDFNSPMGKGRFSSSASLENLSWMENALSGKMADNQNYSPFKAGKFEGLLAPKWPDAFKKIDVASADKGKALYEANCKGCHLPATNTSQFWSDDVFKKIKWYDKSGQAKYTKDRYIDLNIIPLEKIRTDPSQSQILANRSVNTNKLGDSNALGLETYVCIPQKKQLYGERKANAVDQETRVIGEGEYDLITVKVEDSSVVKFALALGAVVQEVNDEWFKANYIPKKDQPKYEGEQPNCLQANGGYKARPLNGIWATAPFLHNGSVPTLDDLLKPQSERPQYVLLGPSEFDVDKVGLKQPTKIDPSSTGYEDGYFVLDTKIIGNLNTGHEFAGEDEPGSLGKKFTEQERKDLIEYLKTL